MPDDTTTTTTTPTPAPAAEKTPEQIIAEAQERRTKVREGLDVQETQQEAHDIVALEQLEQEHGIVAGVRVARYTPGQPTRAYLRAATGAEYKRYNDAVAHWVKDKRPKDLREAQEQLARSVWIYPLAQEDRTSMLGVYPGILTMISTAAIGLAEGKSDEEGKG